MPGTVNQALKTCFYFEKPSLQTVDHVHDLQGFEIKLVSLQGQDASPECNCFGAQKARQGSLQMIHHCQRSASGGQTLPSTLPEQAHCFQFLLLIIARHRDIYLITWDLGSTLTAP